MNYGINSNHCSTKLDPESTKAMRAGVDTRDDGRGKANVADPVPTDGDMGGVW